MAYVDKQGLGYLIRKSNAHDTAINLAAATGTYGGYLVTKPVAVRRFSFYVITNVLAGTTAPIVGLRRRPTYNSASGELTIANLTIPNAAVLGTVYYKDISAYQIHPGDELSVERAVQAADSGTAAGTGFIDVELESSPEVPANESDMIASA